MRRQALDKGQVLKLDVSSVLLAAAIGIRRTLNCWLGGGEGRAERERVRKGW